MSLSNIVFILLTAFFLEMPAPRDAKWKGRVDSHGFRILTDQILELNNKTKDVVVRILRDSIIFQNGSIKHFFFTEVIPIMSRFLFLVNTGIIHCQIQALNMLK